MIHGHNFKRLCPCIPQFCYMGFEGVYVTWTCYPDVSVPICNCSCFPTGCLGVTLVLIAPVPDHFFP